jgi:hypothetical protein
MVASPEIPAAGGQACLPVRLWRRTLDLELQKK